MESSTKKSVKMTTGLQFSQLVTCMDEFPHLATGTPRFGSSKSDMENTWDTVARKVNAYGPPLRTGSEWKKVWIDLKGRLKKKIADNNNSLRETGGGPCRVSNLTELESEIDRICHISAAAAPGGKVCGVLPKRTAVPTTAKQSVINLTPPGRSQKVAVITPTSTSFSMARKSTEEDETFPQQWITCGEKSDSLPTTSQNAKPYRMATSTPKPTILTQRKRKHCDNAADSEGQERLKLLRQQYEIQSQTLDAIKVQAENSKEVAEAVKECTAAIKNQAKSLQEISNAMNSMTKSLFDILWHMCDK